MTDLNDSIADTNRKRQRRPSQTSPILQTIFSEDSNELNPPQRQRRRGVSSEITSSPATESNSASDEPSTPVISIPIPLNDIDQIRSELLQELSYPVADSDYADNSHDWSSTSEFLSTEYWHFLGRYE